MRKTANRLSILLQFVLTFVVLFTVFLIYAIFDAEEADMVNTVGVFIFQPFFASVFSALTMAVCFIIGLPLRFNNTLNCWWKTKPLIPVIGFIVGLLLLLLAFDSNLIETKKVFLNEEVVEKEVPNLAASVCGWFLIAFCLLHFYPVSLESLFRKKKDHFIA